MRINKGFFISVGALVVLVAFNNCSNEFQFSTVGGELALNKKYVDEVVSPTDAPPLSQNDTVVDDNSSSSAEDNSESTSEDNSSSSSEDDSSSSSNEDESSSSSSDENVAESESHSDDDLNDDNSDSESSREVSSHNDNESENKSKDDKDSDEKKVAKEQLDELEQLYGCGKSGAHKVLICHISHGKSHKKHTLCIGTPGAYHHVHKERHGNENERDYFGFCDGHGVDDIIDVGDDDPNQGSDL